MATSPVTAVFAENAAGTLDGITGWAAADVVNKITPADISDPQELNARAAALSAAARNHDLRRSSRHWWVTPCGHRHGKSTPKRDA
ncbi:MAG: hypothetical protein LAQ69_40650 [Acidobacteriia bacterium]|nr:hypothetical protein [Terriglobia bacterium]